MEVPMPRVTGIGGVFFKTKDVDSLKNWYVKHLGIVLDQHGYIAFRWREKDDPEKVGYTLWGPFPEDTKYFEPSSSPFMINLRVDDLHGMLNQLREAGIDVDDRVEDSEYGKFGWFLDPEGTRIELWEPPATGGYPEGKD